MVLSAVVALAAAAVSPAASADAPTTTGMQWPAPPTPLLEDIVEVASEAAAAQHRMFSYVSL